MYIHTYLYSCVHKNMPASRSVPLKPDVCPPMVIALQRHYICSSTLLNLQITSNNIKVGIQYSTVHQNALDPNRFHVEPSFHETCT